MLFLQLLLMNSEKNEIQPLISSLKEISSQVLGSNDNLSFLKSFLVNPKLYSILQVHHKIQSKTLTQNNNNTCSIFELLKDILEDEKNFTASPKNKETFKHFLQLFDSPHVRALLTSYDQILNREFEPILPEVPTEVDEDTKAVKIVQLIKNSEPLGATIKIDEKTGRIYIARVMLGGAADRSGLIHSGDEVHEINGISVENKSLDSIIDILSTVNGTIHMKLVTGNYKLPNGELTQQTCDIFIKVNCSYEPQNDPDIPCTEAGLEFSRGDILHVLNDNDDHWWQAKHLDDVNSRAGLIPSLELITSRLDSLHLPLYEEVVNYQPNKLVSRPLVLVGVTGVGRKQLRREMIRQEPGKFQIPIPYTNRKRQSNEIENVDFHFLSSEAFDNTNRNENRLLDYTDAAGHKYAVTVDCIQEVLKKQMVPILCPIKEDLAKLYRKEIKPFIILIRPPSSTAIKYLTNGDLEKNGPLRSLTNVLQGDKEQLETLEAETEKFEKEFGPFFHMELINDNLINAANTLIKLAQTLSTKPQWLPKDWSDNV